MFHATFNSSGLIFLSLLCLSVPLLVYYGLRQRREIKQLLQRGRHPAADVMRAAPHNLHDAHAYQHFIRYLSHQSTNSLQAILGALTNLETLHANGNALSEQPAVRTHQEALSQIGVETRRLLDMTGKLQLLAQLETGDAPISVQPVQLRSIVADVIMARAEQAHQQGIELVYHGPDRPPRILLDREQITQALHNLVDNSLKYARPDSRRIVISILPDAETLQLTVSDDGAGIPKALLPHVFDVAYRAPDARSQFQSGSGLGLAIVHRIIQQHSGQINMESEYGQGTTVSISLPLA